MEALVRELIPHAPQHGLYLAPDIPEAKLRGALGDYAKEVRPSEVLALYDATRLGSAKDGAVLLADRLVYQNNRFTPPQAIRYEDIVGVRAKRRLLGGRKLEVDVNPGRATTTHALDFSAYGEAAEFVARFLREAMVAAPRRAAGRTAEGSNLAAVEAALERLVAEGALAEADRRRMLAALRRA